MPVAGFQGLCYLKDKIKNNFKRVSLAVLGGLKLGQVTVIETSGKSIINKILWNQNTVGIQNPTIRNPDSFEIRTFLTSEIRMENHSKTGHFVRFSNGLD